MSILIRNASEVVTPVIGKKANTPEESRELLVQKNCSILVEDGKIAETDAGNITGEITQVIDASGCTVLPGFIDPHTHMIFGGSRTDEFYSRIAGMTYSKILQQGGGITRTARETQMADRNGLFSQTMNRVWDSLSHGATTIEIKTGYSHDLFGELKMLDVMDMIEASGIINVVKTFLGLHFTPPGTDAQAFTDKVISEFLPRLSGRARFADVFCDVGAFSTVDSYRFLDAARKFGFKPKAHVDEIGNIGAIQALNEIGLSSADHILKSSVDQLQLLSRSGGIGVVLPITSYLLDPGNMPNIKKFEDAGLPVAIGTDTSPATYCPDMLFAIYLSVRFCGFSIEQAINSATINAARALSEDRKGAVEKGYDADLIILDTPSYRDIPYKFGTEIVRDVITSGRLVRKNRVNITPA